MPKPDYLRFGVSVRPMTTDFSLPGLWERGRREGKMERERERGREGGRSVGR